MTTVFAVVVVDWSKHARNSVLVNKRAHANVKNDPLKCYVKTRKSPILIERVLFNGIA